MRAARLIVEGRQTPHFRFDGPDNMAIDEVLLRSAAERSATTLRFYGWKPATLSLGYFQSYRDRDQHASSREQDCVRRASVGGAIMHDSELTYCLATPSVSRFGDAEVWYAAFHETLVELLSDHGVEASRGQCGHVDHVANAPPPPSDRSFSTHRSAVSIERGNTHQR